jgi:hypothetical protein
MSLVLADEDKVLTQVKVIFCKFNVFHVRALYYTKH